MPAKLRDIERALKSLGIIISKPNGSSHYMAKRATGGPCYPIPAHNGHKSEIPDVYIKGLMRHFRFTVEEQDAFREKL